MIPLPLIPAVDPATMFARAVVATDWWRGDGRAMPGIHTEWMHFVVVAAGFRLLVNFSVGVGGSGGRVLALACDAGRWSGDVATLAPNDVEVRRGRVDAFFGESSVRFSDGAYVVRFDLPGVPLRGWMRLRPVAWPLLATKLKLPGTGLFHWTCVPRLVVEDGEVRGTVTRSLTGCTAYHDHNWGSFAFGGDFAWEWMFAIPEVDVDPWSVMALRICDRARHRVLVAGIAVWRDGRLWRDFRNAEVTFERSGRRSPREDVHRVPAALAEGFEVPSSAWRESLWRGRAREDWLDVCVDGGSLAELLLPTREGSAMLSEVVARVRVDGMARGRVIRATLLGALEVVDGTG